VPENPPVWLDLDQQALDAAYDQGTWAPNRDQVLARYLTSSEQTRKVIGAPERLAYGAGETEQLDLFRTTAPDAPVSIFIHGGGWRGTQAADYAFLAEILVSAGVHCVIPDFAPVDAHAGDLTPMVSQVRRAVAWVYQHARGFGGNPDRLYLTGHSSGAHLGGCLVTTDWTANDLPTDIIKGALLLGGMYDLEPVRLSARSAYLRITDETEAALSPARHLDRLNTPLILSYGAYESPEFRRQTADFFRAVQAAGKPATLLVGEQYNHFELLETLASPYGLLGRALLAQINP
jgi:arylformamidase